MKPAETVSAFRKSLGLSLSQFAYAVGHWDGITPNCLNKTRTIRRWETGQAEPPHWLLVLVQASFALPQLPGWLKARGLSRPSIDPTEREPPS